MLAHDADSLHRPVADLGSVGAKGHQDADRRNVPVETTSLFTVKLTVSGLSALPIAR